jgi:hypothetical protein
MELLTLFKLEPPACFSSRFAAFRDSFSSAAICAAVATGMSYLFKNPLEVTHTSHSCFLIGEVT